MWRDGTVLLLAACVCASCVTTDGVGPSEPIPAVIDLADSLEAFIDARSDMEADDREHHYRTVLGDMRSPAVTPDTALLSSLVLSDPRTSLYSPHEAMRLLETVNATGDDSATVSPRVLHEMLRVFNEAHEANRQEINRLRLELLSEQLRRAELQNQLDALKALEQQMAAEDQLTP